MPVSVLIMLIPDTTYSVLGVSFDAYIPAMLLMAIPGAAYISYLGPVNSLIQRMVGLRMRSITVAVFLFVTNLIGMGLGPVVVGIVSDIMEGSVGVESLRYTMLVFTIIVYPWAAWHFFRAGRYIEQEIKAIEG
ncbi:MAG: hypothetical protein R3360_00835 [Alphaproteobacteria bacterium]|nr:hypothetical protein [Alphaproteobacteria bacterium]